MNLSESRPGKLLLAPMQGLADYVMRDVLTVVGGFDASVSEFVRVSASVLSEHSYAKSAPEVLNGCRTLSGTPVVIQLLGSDPHWLALNAVRAAAVSPHGLDLNFGCPAKVVNRHGGGAMLLNDPDLLNRIVCAVRKAVPGKTPVTAKMRLGVSDTSRAIDCAHALADGGAASIVVHARTRDDGYKPPAHWEWIARIQDAVSVPVVANGEVWSVDDWNQCRAVSGCDDVMIGRGAVSDPFLALRIRGDMEKSASAEEWPCVLGLVSRYLVQLQARVESRHEHGRVKMWLSYLKRTWPQAAQLHSDIRCLRHAHDIRDAIAAAAAAA